MKQRFFALCLALLLLLSGCGERKFCPVQTPEVTERDTQPTQETTPSAVETSPGHAPKQDVDLRSYMENLELADWQLAYIDFLEAARMAEHYSLEAYGLCDMDRDEVPELVEVKRDYPDWTVTVYTCREEKLVPVGEFLGDRALYWWEEERAILFEGKEDGLITGMGGGKATLRDGELILERVEDADLPRTTSELWETPVLGVEELTLYRISAGALEGEKRAQVLPVLLYNAQPEPLSEEEKEVGQARLRSVLEGETMFYHVSEASYAPSLGWIRLSQYCAPKETGKRPYNEQLAVGRTLYQDLNGDGLEEAVLYLEDGKEYGDRELLVLSVQEGMVYGYDCDLWWWEPMEDGILWGRNGRAEYGLRFCRDQAYTWDLPWPRAFLLYKTSETIEGEIRRTTLDPQGTDLSCYFEVPVFQEKGEGYQRINRFFEELTRDFFSPERGLNGAWEYAMEFRNYGKEGPFPYEYTACITYRTDKLVSVVLSSFWNMGGVNSTHSESYTFRTDTGELLALIDLAEGTGEELKAAILETFRENAECFYDLDGVLAAAEEYELEDFEFCLTPEGGVQINLDRYELGRIGAESSASFATGLKLKPEWK